MNPGVVGGYFDLVWFHFTINLAVYGLCLVAAVVWLVTFARERATLAKRPDAVPT